MKIAQFIDTKTLGGAETMLARLSIELSSQGHEVIVFHFGNKYLQRICRKNNIQEIIIPFYKQYKSIITITIFSIQFGRLLRLHNIDILHSHLYGPITGCFIGTWLNRIAHVGTLHDVYMVQERIGRGLLLRIAQLMNVKLITVSKNMQSFYSNYIPTPKNITKIYNGFRREQITPPEDKLLQQLQNSSDIILVTVGRLIPLKRQAQQIKELSAVLKSNNIKLLIVGSGPDYLELNTLIEQEHLQGKVLLLGERNDVQNILDVSDIFILTSETEGLSCSIIEAMAAGLPCIVSDVGGNSELVINGLNGYLFTLNNQPQFLDFVTHLINDHHERQQMGMKSKAMAKNKFSIELMTENYLNIYYQAKKNKY